MQLHGRFLYSGQNSLSAEEQTQESPRAAQFFTARDRGAFEVALSGRRVSKSSTPLPHTQTEGAALFGQNLLRRLTSTTMSAVTHRHESFSPLKTNTATRTICVFHKLDHRLSEVAGLAHVLLLHIRRDHRSRILEPARLRFVVRDTCKTVRQTKLCSLLRGGISRTAMNCTKVFVPHALHRTSCSPVFLSIFSLGRYC